MNKGSPFLNILPSIDLHGYPREMIYVLVDDFINENIKLGKKKILVIHGKGTGVLKEEVRNRFIKDKRVKNLYISMENEGCTIIELNI